ncbi:MAG: ABC transporter permease [Oscillospiraceae bacterium]|nr:ABC transporter permease [Oscillospiraceae bacterium]
MKFGNLLKKELSQLLTKQAIFSMIFTCGLLVLLGQIMGNTMENIETSSDTVYVVVNDDTQFVKDMLDALPDYGTKATVVKADGGMDAAMDANDTNSLLVIPEGFTEKATNGEKTEVELYTRLSGTGLANMVEDSVGTGTTAIEDYLTDYVFHDRLDISEDDTKLANDPMMVVDFTMSNGRTAKIAPSTVSGLMMSLNAILPMAIFFLLMMASTMIMTAISTEKIDKTLETLLSSPVSRINVLFAKMLAAVIVALLNAVSMMVGMAFYMAGFIGNGAKEMAGELMASSEAADALASEAMSVPQALSELGMSLSGGMFLLIGLELFISLAIGLFAALIMGAMATDAQTQGTLALPVMFTTMIPFFVTMFTDVNNMPIPFRMIMYIVPFTHTYTALGNLLFGHQLAFWLGFAYQILFLAVIMYFAVKVFTSDLLFTMKLPVREAKKK